MKKGFSSWRSESVVFERRKVEDTSNHHYSKQATATATEEVEKNNVNDDAADRRFCFLFPVDRFDGNLFS